MKFYLNRQDTPAAIDDLNAGLSKLTVLENFDGFMWEGSIAAGVEVRIPNKMRDGRPCSGFHVLFIRGSNTLVAGDADWDKSKVTLKNYGASTLTAKVFFFP